VLIAKSVPCLVNNSCQNVDVNAVSLSLTMEEGSLCNLKTFCINREATLAVVYG
jgi:hypothetical protein